jgi:hypothetical protein
LHHAPRLSVLVIFQIGSQVFFTLAELGPHFLYPCLPHSGIIGVSNCTWLASVLLVLLLIFGAVYF